MNKMSKNYFKKKPTTKQTTNFKNYSTHTNSLNSVSYLLPETSTA
jgi:hypothetical protein